MLEYKSTRIQSATSGGLSERGVTMTQTEVQHLVQDLLDWIGETLTAYVAGEVDRAEVIAWSRGDSFPDDDQIERLQVTRELFTEVSCNESASVTKAWLTETSCGPSRDMTPVDAIRCDNFDDARASATRLVNDAW